MYILNLTYIHILEVVNTKTIIIINYGNHRVNHSIFPFVLLKLCSLLQ